MAWKDLVFSFKEILTSAKMNDLDANFDALAAGDTGAPRIQTAALEQTAGKEAVTAATIRSDVDVSNKGFNADKVDGRHASELVWGTINFPPTQLAAGERKRILGFHFYAGKTFYLWKLFGRSPADTMLYEVWVGDTKEFARSYVEGYFFEEGWPMFSYTATTDTTLRLTMFNSAAVSAWVEGCFLIEVV